MGPLKLVPRSKSVIDAFEVLLQTGIMTQQNLFERAPIDPINAHLCVNRGPKVRRKEAIRLEPATSHQ